MTFLYVNKYLSMFVDSLTGLYFSHFLVKLSNIIPPPPPPHLKLCPATNNFKWVKITNICILLSC